jgi:hypothetical protein
MRRIISLVVVALIMAAMMLVMVAPAMAQGPVDPPECDPGFHPEPSTKMVKGEPPTLICVPNNGPPISG